MKLKRTAAVVAAATMAASFCGCGTNGKIQTKEKSDDIRLKYIMPGPTGQQDQRMVFDKFNEKLHEKFPKITVDFEIIEPSDYKQKFLLMLASDERVDIAATYCLDYVSDVQNGSFIELDDLLDEYGKETKAALPDWLFDYMKVNDKIYGIPAYQQLDTPYAFYLPKQYAQYLDIEGFKNALYTNDFEKSYELVDSYCKKLSDEGKIAYGIDVSMIPYSTDAYESVKYPCAVRKTDSGKYEAFYPFTDKIYTDFYKWARSWYEKGYIRKDVLTADNTGEQKFKTENGYVMWGDQTNPMMTDKYGENFEIIPIHNYYKVPAQSAAGGVGITSMCKEPEAAMQVLNLLHSDKELYNLITYGIEGTHYKKTGEESIEVEYEGTQAKSTDKYGLWKWIIGNTELSYMTQNDSEAMKKWVFEDVNKAEKRSEFIGFVLNTENIQDKLDQVNAVAGEYFNALSNGTNADWEAKFEEFKSKAEAAGINDCLAECEKQVNDFIENK